MRPIPRNVLLGFVLVCLLAVSAMSLRWFRPLDQKIYDAQSAFLRWKGVTPLPRDVVVIGIDETAYEGIAEPYALWHKHIGLLLVGLAAAKPAVVGIATPLPVRSYEFLVKGVDAPLLKGLNQLAAAVPLVIGQPPGIGRKLRPLAPELIAAAPGAQRASLAICEDSDGIVRRIFQRRCRDDDQLPPFAHEMARELGRQGSPSGMIDYGVGAPIEYTPFGTVLQWLREGHPERLAELVGGKPVVIASLLPSEVRFRLPVALAAWDRASLTVPAAIVHVQALRSMLGRGLVERTEEELSLLLAGLATLFWFGRNGGMKVAIATLAALAVLAGTTFALWHGTRYYTASLLMLLAASFLARLGFEAIRHYREKQLLRTAFAGHVSPQVMRAILNGNLQPDGDGERCQVTILFADIRGFTTRSEGATPEAMIELLNRFYAEAAAAIHSRGGAIDKYIGDGLMATFGLPQPLPAPERNALEAAQDMLVRVNRLNRQLEAEGQAPLAIGVGVHSGEVLAGYVGSRRRRDFTVIGDAVNTASRLEGLTKTLGYPVVCSDPVAKAVGASGGLVDLGAQEIKGRSSMRLWGWNPPLARRLGKGG